MLLVSQRLILNINSDYWGQGVPKRYRHDWIPKSLPRGLIQGLGGVAQLIYQGQIFTVKDSLVLSVYWMLFNGISEEWVDEM